MKEFKVKGNIGRGMFGGKPLPVKVAFENGDYLILQLRPMTQSMFVRLAKEGVKFDDYADLGETLQHGRRIVLELIAGAELFRAGIEDPHVLGEEENDDVLDIIGACIVDTVETEEQKDAEAGLLTGLIEAARNHAVESEKN